MVQVKGGEDDEHNVKGPGHRCCGNGVDTDRSTDSELDPRLGPDKQSPTGSESPVDDVIPRKNGSQRQVSSANLRKQRQRQLVDRTINQATTTRATSLELSRKGLDMIPEQVLRLSELQVGKSRHRAADSVVLSMN